MIHFVHSDTDGLKLKLSMITQFTVTRLKANTLTVPFLPSAALILEDIYDMFFVLLVFLSLTSLTY